MEFLLLFTLGSCWPEMICGGNRAKDQDASRREWFPLLLQDHRTCCWCWSFRSSIVTLFRGIFNNLKHLMKYCQEKGNFSISSQQDWVILGNNSGECWLHVYNTTVCSSAVNTVGYPSCYQTLHMCLENETPCRTEKDIRSGKWVVRITLSMWDQEKEKVQPTLPQNGCYWENFQTSILTLSRSFFFVPHVPSVMDFGLNLVCSSRRNSGFKTYPENPLSWNRPW